MMDCIYAATDCVYMTADHARTLIVLIFIVLICVALAYGLRVNRARTIMIDELALIRGGRPGRGNLRLKNLQKHPRSRSEAEVIAYIEAITGNKFPTAYPKWLVWKGKNLELDGFDGRIAVEFSGPLHTKWFPGTESYASYFERIVKDVVKIRLCKKNKIKLIVIDASLPSNHWRNYILSRLYDFGEIQDKPTVYIREQEAEPFRNKQIEDELALTSDMARAMSI
jgi:hypothetical protein